MSKNPVCRVCGETSPDRFYCRKGKYFGALCKLHEYEHIRNQAKSNPMSEADKISRRLYHNMRYAERVSKAAESAWETFKLKAPSLDGKKVAFFKKFPTVDSLRMTLNEHISGGETSGPEILAKLRDFTEKDVLNPVGCKLLDQRFPNRLRSRTHGKMSWGEFLADENQLIRILNHKIDEGVYPTVSNMAINIRFVVKTPSHFYPSLAAYLFKEFGKDKVIWDLFLGWGGRTLGSFAIDVKSYKGTDLQQDSVNGCLSLVQDLRPGGNYGFACSDFYAYFSALDESPDLIIAGPPFEGLEEYDGVPTVKGNSWVNSIVNPMTQLFKDKLSSGGVFLIHAQNTGVFRHLDMMRVAFSSSGGIIEKEIPCGTKSGQAILVVRKP